MLSFRMAGVVIHDGRVLLHRDADQ